MRTRHAVCTNIANLHITLREHSKCNISVIICIMSCMYLLSHFSFIRENNNETGTFRQHFHLDVWKCMKFPIYVHAVSINPRGIVHSKCTGGFFGLSKSAEFLRIFWTFPNFLWSFWSKFEWTFADFLDFCGFLGLLRISCIFIKLNCRVFFKILKSKFKYCYHDIISLISLIVWRIFEDFFSDFLDWGRTFRI